MSGWAGRVGLFVASLLVVCLAAEGVLRALGYEPLYEVYSSPELFWRRDPLLGWSLEPNAHGRFVGPRPFPIEFDTTIETNSLGLRGPELLPKAPGERRILFLGDSFVAGFEVEQPETFTALVEGRLARRLGQPVRVVNAGVRGYGTDQSYLWFRERGRTLGAELVVAVFSANDFEDNVTLHRQERPFGKPAFALRPNGALELVGVPVPDYEPCAEWVLDAAYDPVRIDGPWSHGACLLQMRLADHSALFTVLATSLARLPAVVRFLHFYPRPGGRWTPSEASWLAWPSVLRADLGAPSAEERSRIEGELTTAILQALAREVRASGARFLLLMIPRHFSRVNLRALRADGIAIDSVAIDGVVDPREIQFRNDSHLNVRGHRLYAEGLVPILEPALRGTADPPASATMRRRQR